VYAFVRRHLETSMQTIKIGRLAELGGVGIDTGRYYG
jgi:hypothetical protein